MIIATAGHVDHGKTLLVKVLTGTDTDRLAEEKRRGLSIDLGFAYWLSPNGSIFGFVDVPGHERFIGNMLAGMTGIDAALLVVAADDGLMPQTYQHLTILDLIGINSGLVVVTKADLVDCERLQFVGGMIKDCLLGTSLERSPIISVSSVTGDGFEELRSALVALKPMPKLEASENNFRMAIDRAFQIHGSGLIVTGTITSGKVKAGDQLKLSPNGQRVRVRTVHIDNTFAEQGVSGQRVGLNITGQGPKFSEAGRGQWLVSKEIYSSTSCLDVEVRLIKSELGILTGLTKVHVHIGTTQVMSRMRLMDSEMLEPDSYSYAQITLSKPISAVFGDRFILRDVGAKRIIGGGRIIDPLASRRGRNKASRVKRLKVLNSSKIIKVLKGLFDISPGGVDLKAFMVARNISKEILEQKLSGISIHRVKIKGSEKAFSKFHWKELAANVIEILKQSSRVNLIEPGLNIKGLRHRIGKNLVPEAILAIIQELLAEQRVSFDGQQVRLPNFHLSQSVQDAELSDCILQILEEKPLAPPTIGSLAIEFTTETKILIRVLRQLEGKGVIIHVSKNRYFLKKTITEFASALILNGIESDGSIQLNKFRNITNLNRNQAIEVLEYFDEIGMTQRTSNVRVFLKSIEEMVF